MAEGPEKVGGDGGVGKVEQPSSDARAETAQELGEAMTAVPEPQLIPLYREFLDGLPEYSWEAPLSDRFERAAADGEAYLEMCAKNLDVLYVDMMGGRNIDELMQIPPNNLSEEQLYAINHWLGAAAHLIEGGVSNSADLYEKSIAYLNKVKDVPKVQDYLESHPLALEASYLEYRPGDPRLEELVISRYDWGVSHYSGGHRHEVLVYHQTYEDSQSGEDYPETGELSWLMLVLARVGYKFESHDDTFRLVTKDGSKEYHLGMKELVKVSRQYLWSILNDLDFTRMRAKGSGISQMKSEDEIPNAFTELGVHAVHGILVLIGKYREQILAEDPAAYNEIVRNLNHVMHDIVKYGPSDFGGRKEAALYKLGGHLLESVLDKDAAPVFYLGGERYVTAEQLLREKRDEIFSDREDVFDGVKLFRAILAASSEDLHIELTNDLSSENYYPSKPIYDVGHSMSGFRRVREILAEAPEAPKTQQ